VERRALVLALALTLPLALYGIPFAYAASTQTTYVVNSDNVSIAPADIKNIVVACTSSSDFALHYGHQHVEIISVYGAYPMRSAVFAANTGDIPNGWSVALHNTQAFPISDYVYILCQSPVTVAGIGVPQFGSLYVAIALGAVAYFMLSKRFTKRPDVLRQA
jgi:hypothetical protein